MHIVGNATIYMGLAVAGYSLLILILGIYRQQQKLIDSAKGGVIAGIILSSISMFLMFYALGTSQFQFEYVASYTSSDLNLIYKLVALWAGNSGSLLLWAFLLTLYTAIITFSKKMEKNPMVPYIMSIMLTNTLFFYIALSFGANPFKTLDEVPFEGNGLNPMLQDPGMILHPVALYLGYVGLVVPFAFALAALILKTTDSFWIKMTRKWTLIAWLFLTIGNMLGGYWAYTELEWGGYWAWDPVENASFLPWLTVTAFLHSVMIQERKNMLKVWNLSLIIISYTLTLFGTFLVRSGILTSVHAFANSNLGTYFLIFMAFAVIFSLYILMSRYHLLRRDPGSFDSLLSKESTFLANNLVLVGAAFAVFWGTIFPLVSEAVRGTKVAVGIPYYNTVMSPILLGLLLLMGICVLIAWQRSTVEKLLRNFAWPTILSLAVGFFLFAAGMRKIYPLISFTIVTFLLITHLIEFYRGTIARRKMTNEPYPLALWRLISKNRRRYGGYIVHLGIALIAIGIIGSNNFGTEMIKTVNLGQQIQIEDYTLTYEDLGQKREGLNTIVYAKLLVEKNGIPTKYVQPEKRFYGVWEEPAAQVAIISNFTEDLYVALSYWELDGKATFIVQVNPLIKWIWLGGFIVIFGTFFAIWNGKYGNITPRYTGPQKKVS